MKRHLERPFATLTGKPILKHLQDLPGWRGALGPGGLSPAELGKARSLAATVDTLVVEPLAHLSDYLIAVLGTELSCFDLRFVRLEKLPDGKEELLFLPDLQFPGGLPDSTESVCDREGALALAASVVGYLGDDDMEFLWDLAMDAPSGGNFLEIGSYCGKSASFLTAALRKRGTGKLFCVDPWMEGGAATHSEAYRALAATMPVPGGERPFEVYLYNAAQHGFLDRVVPLRTRSESAVPLFEERFPFIFVDGHHGYVSVKRDAGVSVGKLAQGGILAFHDVCDSWPEVRSFVEGEFANYPGFTPLGARGSVVAFRKI